MDKNTCQLEILGTYWGIDVNEFKCNSCNAHFHMDDEQPDYCPRCGKQVEEVV